MTGTVAGRTGRRARGGDVAVAALLGLVALVAACRPQRGPVPPAPRPATVRLLLVNDVYVADTLRDGRGGVARIAALRDSVERATGGRVLFLLAGDVLSPSVLGKWYGGAQMVEAFNAARLDYATLGNHEFDGSRANLLARLAESRFTWLSGNCRDATTGAPFPGVRGWDTVRVDGVLLGLFGTTVVRDYPSYVRCADADSATTALVDTLRAAGAALVVGLTHRFIFEDAATLAREPRIDAILGGHEHVGVRIERPDGRRILKAQSNARNAALLTFTRDGAGGGWRQADRLLETAPGQWGDPATEAVVQRWRDSLARRIGPDRVLGIAPVAIDAVDSTSRAGESAFGNLVADAMRAGTGADVALINSGALRFDDLLGPGPISTHQLEGIFLFADETRTVTFRTTGARLRALLETGVQRGNLGSGGYPQVSGVHFAFDPRRANGERLVGALRRPDGREIAPGDSITVTFVTYPACRNGDGYRVPEATAACAALAADPAGAPRTVDLLIRHVERMGDRIVAPPVGRVTRLDRAR